MTNCTDRQAGFGTAEIGRGVLGGLCLYDQLQR